MAASDRPWTGTPSTTQLIQGTMEAFLKITNQYSTSPDKRAFMVTGSKGHKNLEGNDDEYSLLEEKFQGGDITGMADVYEQENGYGILADYKVSGSYKVAKALGMVIVKEPTGEIYKTGKNKGQEKMRSVLIKDESKIDRDSWNKQLNFYRMEFEKRGFPVHEMRIQCIVRDWNTFIARSRGVFRNIYYFKIEKMDDAVVTEYFERKRKALADALEHGRCDQVCTADENWQGLKCAKYCDVAEFCSLGKYLKREKESDDMAIKNLSEIRRLPRLGKIRLGIKKKTAAGVEYPAEVDYFILDPQTPSPTENQKLKDEFVKLYGEKPKQIKIMLPVSDMEVTFPQHYKRYGRTTSLQCRGDGIEATAATDDFTKGLQIIRRNEMGHPVVRCAGRECPYYKEKACSEVATLQVLLPDLPGAGVWQITTGSYHSIVNLNSCIDFIKSVAGRAHMIPLMLERRPQEIGQEGKKRTHYIMQINQDFRLADLQRYALIDSTKILLELPAPEVEKEDILSGENTDINPDQPEPEPEAPPTETKAPPASQKPAAAESEVMITKQQSVAIPQMCPRAGWNGPRLLQEMAKYGAKTMNQLTEKQAAQIIATLNVEMGKKAAPSGKAA